MKKLTFTITADEIEQIAGKKLETKKLETILSIVENDGALWGEIEKSIENAIKTTEIG